MTVRRGLFISAAVVATGVALVVLGRTRAQRAPIRALRGVDAFVVVPPETLDSLAGAISSDFDVDSRGHVLLTSNDGLLEISRDKDGITIDRLSERRPQSFALDGGGALLAITDGFFGEWEDSAAAFSAGVPLPYDGMRLQPSTLPNVSYVIGGRHESTRRVYTFFGDGAMQIEAEVPDTVVAVSDNSQAVYFASKRNIYRATSKSLDVVVRLPANVGDVVSIATAPADDALYFATDSVTYVLSGLSAIALASDIGGTLRSRNGKLYVWSPSRRMIVSLDGMHEVLRRAREDM